MDQPWGCGGARCGRLRPLPSPCHWRRSASGTSGTQETALSGRRRPTWLPRRDAICDCSACPGALGRARRAKTPCFPITCCRGDSFNRFPIRSVIGCALQSSCATATERSSYPGPADRLRAACSPKALYGRVNSSHWYETVPELRSTHSAKAIGSSEARGGGAVGACRIKPSLLAQSFAARIHPARWCDPA